MLQLVVLSSLICSIFAFELPSNLKSSFKSLTSLHSTWQEDLDEFLDIDTTSNRRRSLTRDLFGKVRDVTKDLRDAVAERDIDKIAPKNLQYGKAVRGLQDFQNQLVSDIIPEILTKGVPQAVEVGPEIAKKLISNGPKIPRVVAKKSIKNVNKIKEITQDPTKFQSTVEDIQREIRNIVKSTPEGLESPSYETLQTREYYDIRKYYGYSIVSTNMKKNEDDLISSSAVNLDPSMMSSNFNKLANYLFGNNTSLDDEEESEKMSMTTPVIMNDNTMSFILPSEYNADTAPRPKTDDIIVKDVVGPFIVAVRQFTGYTTENEINRQKAKLEDSLLNDNIEYNMDSFQVLNYNPPFTVPWVRRNEIMFTITMKELPPVPLKVMDSTIDTDASDIDMGKVSEKSKEDSSPIVTMKENEDNNEDDEEVFFSSPEAGD